MIDMVHCKEIISVHIVPSGGRFMKSGLLPLVCPGGVPIIFINMMGKKKNKSSYVLDDSEFPVPDIPVDELVVAEKEFREGDRCLDAREYHRAVEHYSLSIKLNPNFCLAYLHRSQAYIKMHNLSDSLEDSSKSIELDPSLNLGYIQKGSVLLEMKLFEDALRIFNTGLTYNPDDQELKDYIVWCEDCSLYDIDKAEVIEFEAVDVDTIPKFRVEIFPEDQKATTDSIDKVAFLVRNSCAGFPEDYEFRKNLVYRCVKNHNEKYLILELVLVEDGKDGSNCQIIIEKSTVYLCGFKAQGEFYEMEEKQVGMPRRFTRNGRLIKLLGNVSYGDEVDYFIVDLLAGGVRFLHGSNFSKDLEKLQIIICGFITAFCEGVHLGPVAKFVREQILNNRFLRKSKYLLYLLWHWSQLSNAIYQAIEGKKEKLEMMNVRYSALHGCDLVDDLEHAKTIVLLLAVRKV